MKDQIEYHRRMMANAVGIDEIGKLMNMIHTLIESIEFNLNVINSDIIYNENGNPME